MDTGNGGRVLTDVQLLASTPVNTHGSGEVAWKLQSTKCNPLILFVDPAAELSTRNTRVAVTLTKLMLDMIG